MTLLYKIIEAGWEQSDLFCFFASSNGIIVSCFLTILI
ncbi:hypothetical protein SGODD07_00308 [Streptococcus gordonii]|uniref:Uncharacterized protein n=1 Tax=Streptococcus gordonii TaxID=1302 RepID=A0A139NDN8_STRGN|nr:hypothetical protein SGODD07_00308 [Streptococcus gordonii]